MVCPMFVIRKPTSPSPPISQKGTKKGATCHISQLICIILLTKNANVILAWERNIDRKIHKDHEASPPIQMNVPLVASNKLCSPFSALI